MAIGDRDADLARTVADELGNGVVAAPLDVTDPASWAAFLEEIAAIGPIDVLVNNAGIMPLGSVLKEPDEVARRIVDVNLHGVIFGTKAVAPGMVERGRGHVVNVASAVGRVARGRRRHLLGVEVRGRRLQRGHPGGARAARRRRQRRAARRSSRPSWPPVCPRLVG